MLRLYSDNMFADAVGENGIQAQTEKKNTGVIESVVKSVVSKSEQGEYGFVNLVSSDDLIKEVEEIFSQLSWASVLVIVGIGGSDLGGRAILNALSGVYTDTKVVFHGDSTDPTDLDKLLREVNLEVSVFNIVSKSGTTMETASQYLYIRQMYEQRGLDWTKHFVFTTGEQEGILAEEAERYGIFTLPIPEDVGGRFSVLSPVGLLPALAMGVDIRSMVRAAAEVVSNFVATPSESLSTELAEQQYLLYEQGVEVSVLMPYSSKLKEFARWYRQLWAESLGKDREGILPVQAYGPADQHSQLQFYTEGTFLASVLFLRVTDHGSSHVIQQNGVKGLEYLQGKDFADIINIEQEATELSLTKSGRPSATIELNQVTASTMGELFMSFELAVVILGELLEVNVFNQPGVQESKDFMYAMLGREGFEDILKEIESFRQ